MKYSQIKLTASEWHLYQEPGCEDAAAEINAICNEAVDRAFGRIMSGERHKAVALEVIREAQDAIDKFGEFGSQDSEPQREVAEVIGKALFGDLYQNLWS